MNVNFGKTIAFKLAFPAILIIALGAWATLSQIKSDVRLEAGESLTALVNTTQQAVLTWFDKNKSDALHWANTKEVRKLSAELLSVTRTKDALLTASAQAKIRDWLHPIIISKGYRGFFIVGPKNINLSSSRDENVGTVNLVAKQKEFFDAVWSGSTAASLPQYSDVPLVDASANLVERLPTMFVGAPIKNLSGTVISILLFRIDPAAGFTSIFQQARMGQSGETYAFDQFGRLISESRFDDHLRQIGLIPDGKRGILNIEIRNPKVNMVLGERSNTPRNQQPLTLMAKSAIAGETRTNLEGYRDYRGVPVIGSWLWNAELKFGITSEIDIEEVNRSQFTTRVVFLIFVSLSINTHATLRCVPSILSLFLIQPS